MSIAFANSRMAPQKSSVSKKKYSGVTSVGASRMIPLQGGGMGLGDLRVPGVTGPESDGSWDADWDAVSPD